MSAISSCFSCGSVVRASSNEHFYLSMVLINLWKANVCKCVFDVNLLFNVLFSLYKLSLFISTYYLKIPKLLLKQPFLTRLTEIFRSLRALKTVFALNHELLLGPITLHQRHMRLFVEQCRVLICIGRVYSELLVRLEVFGHHYKPVVRIVEVLA